MSWNTCRHPECENWTYRPDVDYCETHRRANAKEEAEAKKQVEKRTTLIAKQREKGKQPRKTISKVSHKREKINKEYYKLVEQFKKDNPKCNAKINQYCTGATEDPHHSRGREIDPEYFLNLGLNPPITTTTRQRQIEFMSFLYGQGFSCNEIARLYGTTTWCVNMALQRRYKKLKA